MIDFKEAAALQQLIAASDDQTAYERLYRLFYFPLLRFSISFTRSKPAAEEIVSDVFLQIWQMRRRLHTINNLPVYLYTSIRNYSLNYLAQRRHITDALPDEESLSVAGTSPDPEQLYISAELNREIDLAIQQLPPKCRLVFKLIREDGLKYREVADIMNISQKTVEAQMGIAMKKLGEAVRRHMGNKRVKQGVFQL